MGLPQLLIDTRDALESQRSALLEALAGLDASLVNASPAEGEWSVAQVVDHLLLAEEFTNAITGSLAEKAREAGAANGFPADLSSFAALPPPIGMEAPPPIRPSRTLTDLAAELTAMRSRTVGAFDALATVDPRAHVVPHPLFGPLDLGQWWVLQSVHYGMHLAQARAALEAARSAT
jgi:hypothetical protein